jgi:hypothetical protein
VTRGNHVAVRLDADTVARVDALAPTLSTAWHTATRSDALRYLILEGLAVVEPQAEPPHKGKQRK